MVCDLDLQVMASGADRRIAAWAQAELDLRRRQAGGPELERTAA
jgi:hypothetical protein